MNSITVERIFALMEEKNITAKEASDATGISQARFSGWKKNRYLPNSAAIVALAKYLDVSVDYLSGNDNTDNQIDIEIQAEIQQLNDIQKAETLSYIKYIKQKEG